MSAVWRAIAFAAIAFTFLCGLVFTVIPILLSGWAHLVVHVWTPLLRWYTFEPRFAAQMNVVLSTVLLLTVSWVARGALREGAALAWAWVRRLLAGARRPRAQSSRPATPLPPGIVDG